MMLPESGSSPERPIILGRIAAHREIPGPRGGGGRARFADPEGRSLRIDARFEEALAALCDQMQISDSIHAADPQLVLVLEALDEQIDLAKIARKIGLEILVEAESAIDPTDEFQLMSAKAEPYIGSCCHAVCADEKAFGTLRWLWSTWRKEQELPRGYATLRDLFAHLKDVRPWGPQDRLGAIDWDEYFAGRVDDRPQNIEIELWYRRSAQRRQKSQREVTALIEQAGGQVVAAATVEQIGYHGLKCTVPTQLLRDLASGNHDSVRLVRSANVMYVRVSGQALPAAAPSVDLASPVGGGVPAGEPVLCLLDGVPAVNHPLLRGRVEIYDPDDLTERATVDELQHGTWMSSVAVWGDRGAGEDPATRPVLVRPILTPSDETSGRVEELPADELAPDLMCRVFRELFHSAHGQPAAGESVTIVSISVGDPAAPFETIMSSWARSIDWLSYHYGALVIVSAGNHRKLVLTPSSSKEVIGLRGEERRRAILEALARQQASHRLLAPAASVNAVSVGAIHDDASKVAPLGYVVDPTDGLPAISPVSPTGSGYRRSIKPELVVNGGRVLFRDGITNEQELSFTGSSAIGPGIKVAAPAGAKETHISGTSPAAALIARRAARLHDVVSEITAGEPLTRRQKACAIKALLAHGTVVADTAEHEPVPARNSFGNGAATRDFADGCARNEAVMLFVGEIGANQEQELRFPLPNGLNVREVKRIEATLAWLSPVNWRHRQYRQAALSLIKPDRTIPKLGKPTGLGGREATRGAATLHRYTWELRSAFAEGQGSDMVFRVKCYEQAGGLGGKRIDFAVVLSLWVAPALNVDVYSQVRAQVRAQVSIPIRS